MMTLLNYISSQRERFSPFVILCLGLLLYSCEGNTAQENKVNTKAPVVAEQPISTAEQDSIELAEGEEPKVNFTENPSIQEISDSLRISLSQKSLGFFSELVPMSEDRSYKDGAATLVRKYEWNVSFPVTVSMGDVLVFAKRGTDKILVTISKLKIGKRFSFGNEKASTITKDGWVTESAKDQNFWKEMDKISKSKMIPAVFNNKKVTNKMRNQAINLVITEINETLAGTGAANNQFEFIIERISY
jgi:hypothetical protein